jgi:hypothetical protein
MSKKHIKKRLGSIRFLRLDDPYYDWEALEKSLYYEGYQPGKYGYIEVHNDTCVNGNHRMEILTRCKENLDRCIWVAKVNNWSYFSGITITIILSPLFLPYFFLFSLVRRLLKATGLYEPKVRHWTDKRGWHKNYRIKEWKKAYQKENADERVKLWNKPYNKQGGNKC